MQQWWQYGTFFEIVVGTAHAKGRVYGCYLVSNFSFIEHLYLTGLCLGEDQRTYTIKTRV